MDRDVEMDWRPPVLTNRVSAYQMPEEARRKYEEEVQEWIRVGFLPPYDG